MLGRALSTAPRLMILSGLVETQGNSFNVNIGLHKTIQPKPRIHFYGLVSLFIFLPQFLLFICCLVINKLTCLRPIFSYSPLRSNLCTPILPTYRIDPVFINLVYYCKFKFIMITSPYSNTCQFVIK